MTSIDDNVISREYILLQIYKYRDTLNDIPWGRICEYILYVMRVLPEQFTVKAYETLMYDQYRMLGRVEDDGYHKLDNMNKNRVVTFAGGLCRR